MKRAALILPLFLSLLVLDGARAQQLFGPSPHTTTELPIDPTVVSNSIASNPPMHCYNLATETDFPCFKICDEGDGGVSGPLAPGLRVRPGGLQVAPGVRGGPVRPSPGGAGFGAGCATCSVAGPGGLTVPGISYAGQNSPVSFGELFFWNQSLVDNQVYNFMHFGNDVRCSVGSSLALQRIFRSRDLDEGSSFGPGVFHSYDIRLTLDLNYSYSSGDNWYYTDITLFDPTSNVPVRLASAPSYGDVLLPSASSYLPGASPAPTLSRVKHLELLDSQQQPLDLVSNAGQVSGAAYARLNSWNGDWFLFELVNTELPPSNPGSATPSHGRLIEARTADNSGYTIGYKSWTTAELEQSPSRQWQLDLVTDFAGPTLSFDYNSQQQGGQWAVSKITLSDNTDIDYSYAGGFLSTVTYDDGLTSTFAYADNSVVYGTIKMTIDDVMAPASSRKQEVILTGSVATSGGSLVPTSVGMARVLRNGEGEISYLNDVGGSNNLGVVYEGGGRMKASIVIGDTPTDRAVLPGRYYKDGWDVAGDFQVAGSFESQSTEFYGNPDNDPLGNGGSLGTATLMFAVGNPASHRDERGVYREFDYDARGNPVYTFFSDGTFEAYCYDQDCNKVTRARDREGNVTQYVYDSVGRLTEERVGLTDGPSNQGSPDPYSGTGYNRCPTDDVQTAEYAVRSYQYYSSGSGDGKLAKITDELGNETDYEYNSSGQLFKMIAPPDVTGGPRAEVQYFYNVVGRLASVADPLGNVTAYTYDGLGRQTTTTYSDGSTEKVVYGTTGPNRGLVIKSIDRGGVVTSYAYDQAGRVVTTKKATSIVDGSGNETPTPEVEFEIVAAYLAGSNSVATIRNEGALTEFKYDYRGRKVEHTQHVRAGVTLTTKESIVNNRQFVSEDPYGRKSYSAYDATDGRLIRTIQGTVPSYSLTDEAAVLAEVRNTAPNPNRIVSDSVIFADGMVSKQIDGLGTETHYSYDSRGRSTIVVSAIGTAVEARTESFYDLAGKRIEIRSPRYFDSSDVEGYQKAYESWTYNGRGFMSSHSEAPGTALAATETFSYDLKGRQVSRTDFRGKTWTTVYDSCCEKSVASKNPLGHGTILNSDARGLDVHSVQVSDIDSHINDMLSPINTKTLSESTKLHDGLGRPIAKTVWLVPRGAIDTANPPIAGWNGVSAADGFTSQYMYDDNLSDGVGLDGTAGTTPLLGGNSVSLAAALTKLADTKANGGAETSFYSDAPGNASVLINAAGNVSFSISDAAGRAVMTGRLDSSNGLLSWDCKLYDTIVSVAGFGDCLENRSIDALGNSVALLSNGAGQVLQAIDQLGKSSTFTYNAVGNQLSVRDANNVGHDVVFDELGRAGLTTDTAGHTANSTYDKAGRRVASIDGKGKSTSYVYDARGRQISKSDRLGNTTSFSYLPTGQLATVTDAEGQTTTYTYNANGQKQTEQAPDHTGGAPGDSSYGIVNLTLDAADRLAVRQDQNGDTITYNYDLAGRLTSRDYRTAVNSPGGALADSDAFTYDAASRMLTAVSQRYGNTVTYTYDEAGRKATETLNINLQDYTVGYSYDSKNQLTKLTYPDGTVVERSLTDRGELQQLSYSGTVIDTRSYDDGGRMISSSYNNGVSESRSYDMDDTLTNISFLGANIGDLSYNWDANKNKTSEVITGTMSGYGFTVPNSGFDSEDRLVESNRSDGNLDQVWALSDVGDWDSITTEGSIQSRTHGPSHELLTAGGAAASHDVKGNVTLIPASLRSNASALGLVWDMDNRLSTADIGDDGSVDATYKFDALGRRVFQGHGTSSTVYVPSGQQTIADYVSGTTASTPSYNYVYGSYVDEPVYRDDVGGSDDVYFHRNQQYSVVALTNAGGATVERYAYSAYGVLTIADSAGIPRVDSAHNNRYTYTGREWDKIVGLYHFRAREYDASLGRFCSRDSKGFPDGWNQYQLYIGLQLLDPSGLATCPSGGETNGKLKNPCPHLEKIDPAVIPTVELCKVMFEIAKTPIKADKACDYCKKLPKVGPFRDICKKVCDKVKKATGKKLIELMCCSGVTPKPAAPCLLLVYRNGRPYPGGVTKCEYCCNGDTDPYKKLWDHVKPEDRIAAISNCKKACNAAGSGF